MTWRGSASRCRPAMATKRRLRLRQIRQHQRQPRLGVAACTCAPSPLSLSSSLCRHFLHFATFLCRAHKSSHTAPPVNPAKRRRIDSLAGVGVGAGVACTWQMLSLVGRQHVPIARTTVLVSQCELWRIGYKSCFRCAFPSFCSPLCSPCLPPALFIIV